MVGLESRRDRRMAGAAGAPGVTERRGHLIAVDGTSGVAIAASARTALASVARSQRAGVSAWDASGIFQDLIVAEDEAGIPLIRTLLLLYASDLAFRLR